MWSFSKEEGKRGYNQKRRKDLVILYKMCHCFSLGHVGITDFRGKKAIAEDEARMKSETICQDIVSFSLDKEGKVQEISGQKQIKGFNPTMPEYNPEAMKLYWAYDTPGVINPEQVRTKRNFLIFAWNKCIRETLVSQNTLSLDCQNILN